MAYDTMYPDLWLEVRVCCCYITSVISDSLQLHSMDNSLSGSSVHGILKTRILEWVAIFPSGDFSHPGIELMSLTSPALAGGFFTNSAT